MGENHNDYDITGYFLGFFVKLRKNNELHGMPVRPGSQPPLMIFSSGMLSEGETAIYFSEGVKRFAMTAKPELQLSAGFNQPGCSVHELLDNCADSTTLCGVANRRMTTNEAKLPDKP